MEFFFSTKHQLNDFVWGGWGGSDHTIPNPDQIPSPEGILASPHSDYPYFWFNSPSYDIPDAATNDVSSNPEPPSIWDDPGLSDWVDLSKE